MNSIQLGENKFCGPSVISAICGVTTDEAAAVISSITGKQKVTGVYPADLKKAFNKLGYSTTDVKTVGNSLYSVLMFLHGKENGMFVFMVPGHFIAIESDGNKKYICDNHTKEPLNIGSSARLGQKVISCFKVVKQ